MHGQELYEDMPFLKYYENNYAVNSKTDVFGTCRINPPKLFGKGMIKGLGRFPVVFAFSSCAKGKTDEI